MCKNKVQFQKSDSLIELFQDYGTESQCYETLFKLRRPNGLICQVCGCRQYCYLKAGKQYQCNRYHHPTSLISGTIFEQTKIPLTRWFLAIHLITQSKSGISALALKREIGVSYNTAWRMKHKIMQVMKERDDCKQLSGIIQSDDEL